MLEKLQPELEKNLPHARSLYVATALLKTYGYQLIENLLPASCKRKYLIGIDLPSDPSVFKVLYQLPESHTESRIYNGRHTFHPKVYIIEKADGTFVAFIGSANTTNGGLLKNIEMSVKVDDPQQCEDLLKWFNKLFTKSSVITEQFINEYRVIAPNLNKRQSSNRADVAALKKTLISPADQGAQLMVPDGQFFKQAQYDAYKKEYWEDYRPEADERRLTVRRRFEVLDHLIFPQFSNFGLQNLHQHSHAYSRISHYQYRKGFNNHVLQSMWLHYGYAKSEYSDSFGEHPRIQVIIHQDRLSTWLVIGKDHGSWKERKYFKERLEESQDFRELIYQLLTDLGDIYELHVAGENRHISEFTTADILKNYLIKDHPQHYFIIRRAFNPDDDALSESAIAETILLEFKRLYPIYNHIRIFV